MNSLFYPHTISHPRRPATQQMIVEGTRANSNRPLRVGTILSTPRGVDVEIIDYESRKPKTVARFSTLNTDAAVAMVHGHDSMQGYELTNVY